MTGELLDVGDEEVHLWHVDPTAIADAGRLDRYAGWLSAEEVARRGRFIFERHRHAFLVARALVRGTLARYVGAPPAALRFTIGEHGRPELDLAAGRGLSFNLSHTDGRAVLAVARATVGVDVEAAGRRGELARIAEHFFAPAEVAALAGLSGAALRERFFAFWTLKEAYIKARGVGVSLGLGRFWFEAGAEAAAPRIAFEDGFDDDPAAWCFRRLELAPGHPAAVALRRPAGSALRIRAWEGIPGEDDLEDRA